MHPIRDQGFHVERGVLSERDLGGIRAAVTETIDRAAHAMRAPFDTSCPDASFDERLDRVALRDHAYANALFHAVMADAQRDERISGLARHHALVAAVARAVAPERMTGAVVRTRAVIPSLSAHRSPWHQDVLKPADDGRSCGSVRIACWIPLREVDQRSGALEVMPGRWSPLPHRNDDGHFSIREECLPQATRNAVPLQAGDVLLLDRFLPHRSLAATAPRARWAVVLWVKAAAADANYR
jgi:ectoine hydroxylase-related dioxygenase (phytanoyl-CoA dioxygenase family)